MLTNRKNTVISSGRKRAASTPLVSFPFHGSWRLILLVILPCVLLSGCGTFRSYHSETNGVVAAASQGNLDNAISTLESNNTSDDKDLLYFFEKGELLHLKNDIPPSTAAWLSADEKIRIWEDEVKTDPGKFFGAVGSYIVNDKTRRYDGYDYEKVMLSSLLALNHTLAGDWDKARTEIKKTHEREAIIAEFRSKEIDKVEEQAKEKDVKTTYKDLQGYPVETLDDPEVISLKNGYQNAFSHYLAGFVYEAMGEPSLAAPGYKTAIELRPNIKILEAGLKGVDSRRQRLKPNQTDVLFIVSCGTVPSRKSLTIPIPVPLGKTVSVFPISFPLIRPDTRVFVPGQVTVDSQPVSVTPITSIDAMSRRALRDEMPGIIVRSVIRAGIKGVAQKVISDKLGVIGNILSSVAAVATEQADERAWRTLPAQIAIGRAVLPTGRHTLEIQTPSGVRQMEITLNGSHAVVPLRLMESTVYLAQPRILQPNEMLAANQVTFPSAAEEETQPPVKKAKKVKKSRKSRHQEFIP
jgi:hypothetical protein